MASPGHRLPPTLLLILFVLTTTTTTILVSSTSLLPPLVGQQQPGQIPLTPLQLPFSLQQPAQLPNAYRHVARRHRGHHKLRIPAGEQQPISVPAAVRVPPLPRPPPPKLGIPGAVGGAVNLRSFTNGKGSYKRMAHEFLESHNKVRAQMGEAPFVWDPKLARFARRWSDTRRVDCAVIHSGSLVYGENMFWGTGWDWRASDAVKTWSDEEQNYNRADNSCAPGKMCGHFTQMVWNSTISVGCARVECFAGGVIITCNYEPPGNMDGESPFGVTG